MAKLLRKLALCILPVLCVAAAAACSAPTGPQNYNVAGVQKDIPAITSVVGERTFVGSSISRYANPEDGNLSVLCTYCGSNDVAGDIERYCAELTQNNSFTLEHPYDGQSAVLTAQSTIEGQSICMTITPANDDGYNIETKILEESYLPDAVSSEAA